MDTTWTDTTTNTILFRGTGSYTYDGKHLTYTFPFGSQEAEVVWTDADHLTYQTLASTLPGAAGVVTVMTRIKK